VQTLTADDQKRIQIPDAEPGQKFTYEQAANGAIVLTPINGLRPERPCDPHLYDHYPEEAAALEDATAKWGTGPDNG
jgi:hypothetical protein